jgi:hypothetical protein
MGDYGGLLAQFPLSVSEQSPGCAVCFVGWLLLLLPAIQFIIVVCLLKRTFG